MEDNFANEEYAAQLFSVRPSDIIYGLHEDVKYCFKNHAKMLESLLNKLPKQVLPEREKEQGLIMVNSVTSTKIDTIFGSLLDHFKKYLLCIPDNVLLEEDDEQKVQHTLADKKLLEEELESLRLQLTNEKFVISKLKEEAIDVGKVLDIQKDQIKILSKCDLSGINQSLIFSGKNLNLDQLISTENESFADALREALREDEYQ